VDVLANPLGSAQPINHHGLDDQSLTPSAIRTIRPEQTLKPPQWLLPLYRAYRPTDPYCYYPALAAALRQLLTVSRYSLVVSVAEPLVSHEIILKHSEAFEESTLISVFGDPVPTAADENMMKLRLRRERCKSIATRIADRSAVSIAPTREILDFLAENDHSERRTLVLPHSFDSADWPFPSQSSGPVNERITLLHCGALYYRRRPDNLIEGVLLAQAEKPDLTWRLKLVGSVDPALRLNYISGPGSGLISLSGPVTYTAARSEIRNADILAVIDCDLERNIHLPAKVADYVGACKPILYIGQPTSPTCRLLAPIHPLFEQAQTPLEIKNALLRLVHKMASTNTLAYRRVYDALRFETVYQPINAIARSAIG